MSVLSVPRSDPLSIKFGAVPFAPGRLQAAACGRWHHCFLSHVINMFAFVDIYCHHDVCCHAHARFDFSRRSDSMRHCALPPATMARQGSSSGTRRGVMPLWGPRPPATTGTWWQPMRRWGWRAWWRVRRGTGGGRGAGGGASRRAVPRACARHTGALGAGVVSLWLHHTGSPRATEGPLQAQIDLGQCTWLCKGP